MDQFAEQLVKKITTTQDDLKKVLLLVCAAVLMLISLYLTFFVIPIAFVLPLGIGYLTFYLLKLLKTEYEYSCTNGTLDIDKILGQTKRVNMLTVEVKEFTAYGKSGVCPESDEEMTTFYAIGSSLMGEEDDSVEYYAEFNHPDHGKCCLYFCPNARFREALEPFLPRTIRKAV